MTEDENVEAVAESIYYAVNVPGDIRLSPEECNRAAKSAIEAYEAQQGWQPIDTAPKRSDAIIVNTGYAHDAWQYVVAHYRNGYWIACCSLAKLNPTHWQSLPPPPAEQ